MKEKTTKYFVHKEVAERMANHVWEYIYSFEGRYSIEREPTELDTTERHDFPLVKAAIESALLEELQNTGYYCAGDDHIEVGENIDRWEELCGEDEE